MVALEHVLDQAVVLAEVQAPAFGRANASGVLAAVLEHREAVKEHLIDLFCWCYCVWRMTQMNVSLYALCATGAHPSRYGENNPASVAYMCFFVGEEDTDDATHSEKITALLKSKR
jgi:hypothetical protein